MFVRVPAPFVKGVGEPDKCLVSSLQLLLAGQMFLMDRFFDGTFLTFGIEVISFAERDQEDRIDPMVREN